MQDKWNDSYLFGSNIAFIEELYENYLISPQSVDKKWRDYFDKNITNPLKPDVIHQDIQERFANITANSTRVTTVNTDIDLKVYQLILAYRTHGIECAKLNPLHDTEKSGILNPEKYGINNQELTAHNPCNQEVTTIANIVKMLDKTYCGSVAFEFSHIVDDDIRLWLNNYVETGYHNYQVSMDEKKRLLYKLTQADTFERFLNTKYVGQKRFSLEGADSLIPGLDYLINLSAKYKVGELYIGMAHRGRLNTMVNIAGKPPKDLFKEFDGSYELQNYATSGDVKYHKGCKCTYITDHGQVKVAIAYNASHLEAVNPVLNGMVYSRIDALKHADASIDVTNKILGVIIHGDAALIGLGTNQGVLSMSNTDAYGVGGIIHIVINNQVGFTNANTYDVSSSMYCTDIAKMVDMPIIHVNADDVEGLTFALKLALDYKMLHKKDIIIDLIGYRRYGHNEADDPTITQPYMYRQVKQHPGSRALYANKLIQDKIITQEEATSLVNSYKSMLDIGEHIDKNNMISLQWYSDVEFFGIKEFTKDIISDGASAKIGNLNLLKKHRSKFNFTQDFMLRAIKSLVTLPNEQFVVHPAVNKLNENRKLMAKGEVPIDFSLAETLAYASLLDSGVSVRISGEDSQRGTFTHRHAVWHDYSYDGSNEIADGLVTKSRENALGAFRYKDLSYTPLVSLCNKGSKFNIYNSILNEECVLGFEYGYSTVKLGDLVIWEAQFGDFANGAQVIIDQFIVSSAAKWGVLSNLTLMLPHGFDGQGPEHSSARIERYLQLCAENNIMVVYPSTSAQVFHALRYRAVNAIIKPMVIFVSKRLLRYKNAMSNMNELFGEDGFCKVIGDNVKADKVILCTGQIYYDLINKIRELPNKIAVVRLEQLYPFPTDDVVNELKKYTLSKSFVWVQEEPINQGSWVFIRDKLNQALSTAFNKGASFTVVARNESATTACGLVSTHKLELERLLDQAIG